MREANPHSEKPSSESPLSLHRLREAFAAMLGQQGAKGDPSPQPPAPSPQTCEINPRSVVEAVLFVGRPDNGTHSSRELAAAMRGVSPAEIDAAVRELNVRYDSDHTPYRIEGSGTGYRLVLRDEFRRMRDKFYGRIREAKLSPAAMEVLSIIAYNQPASAERINELRSGPNSAALSTLVRRQLVRIDRPENGAGKPLYSTTERFLKLFGLDRLDALPRSEELDKI